MMSCAWPGGAQSLGLGKGKKGRDLEAVAAPVGLERITRSNPSVATVNNLLAVNKAHRAGVQKVTRSRGRS
jgi:hypothetical protein